MRAAINDASILIDLSTIDLLNPFLNLSFDMMATDFVIEEIKDAHTYKKIRTWIDRKRLTVITSTLEEMNAIQELALKLSSLSYSDCSVYFHSQKLSAILLTGDSHLRKEAESSGLEVHGILWVFDILIARDVITKDEAFNKLNELLTVNTRLPHEECQKRLKKWNLNSTNN